MHYRYIFTSKSPEPKQAELRCHLISRRRNAGSHASSLLARLTPTVPIVSQTTPPLICTRQRLWQADHHPIKAQHEKIQQQRGADSPSYRFLSTEALPLTGFGADLTLGILNQFLLVKKRAGREEEERKKNQTTQGSRYLPLHSSRKNQASLSLGQVELHRHNSSSSSRSQMKDISGDPFRSLSLSI